MITPLPHHYRTTTVVLPYQPTTHSRSTTGGNGMEWNGMEGKGIEGHLATYLDLGLWLIANSIQFKPLATQHARPRRDLN
jgi:hypothetical protein